MRPFFENALRTASAALVALLISGSASAQHFVNANTGLSVRERSELEDLLKKHAKLTDETIGLEFVADRDPGGRAPAIEDSFRRWAPSTKKPVNSILVRIHKDTGAFELFTGAGFNEVLGSDGTAKLKKAVATHGSLGTGLAGRVTLIVRALLVQIESPLLAQENSPLGALIAGSGAVEEPKPVVADPAHFGRGAGIAVIFLLLLVGGVALYRTLYTEIHVGARTEKRVSPLYGKFRRPNLERDLITGGGVGGHWDR